MSNLTQSDDEIIIKQYTPMAAKLCRSFYKRGNFYSYEDLLQTAKLAIFQANKFYDPRRAKRSTFFFYAIKNALLRFVQKYNRHDVTAIVEKPYVDTPSIIESDRFSVEQKRVLELLVDGHSGAEIMKKLKMSRYTYNKLLASLKKMKNE